MEIPFLKPDISESEIEAVVETLRSGWITTGPKVRQFEKELSGFCGTERTICMNSATAALECALRILGIGPGDEVITTPYTYTASCSVIDHVGATPVLVDIAEDSLEMDYDKLASAITSRTKAVIPVDVGGIMCDYDRVFDVVGSRSSRFHPSNDIQSAFGRAIVLADAAHSLGATYLGRPSGSVADFTAFSFHAVKNLTTAEGGALTWRNDPAIDGEAVYRSAQLLSLHGQTKSALEKTSSANWEYDIETPAFKWNMTDIMAAIGLAQLQRYPAMLARRRQILEAYRQGLDGQGFDLIPHYTDMGSSSGHLALLRIEGASENDRNRFIEAMLARGVSCNVHYKPLPMLTAYRRLGFKIIDYPHAYDFYRNEVTLPLHTLLGDDEVAYIIESAKASLDDMRGARAADGKVGA